MQIGIIKLGADGDVLRTIPLAVALKKQYPESVITWITKGDVASLLETVSALDHVIRIPYHGRDTFDRLYNFDVDNEALMLMARLESSQKYGFYEREGFPAAHNSAGEYYLNTMFDDELKKNNTKTYQEMMFAVAELPVSHEPYHLELEANDMVSAQHFLKNHGLLGKKIVGIHMGASSRWPSKAWHTDCVKRFIGLAQERGYEVILFGGPNEVAQHEVFCTQLEKEGIMVYCNVPTNTKREFAALVSVCSALVCADSFALHVALGLGKKTIGLFFVTSPNEIESYGMLTKLVSPRLLDFFPEKSDKYDEELTKSIMPEEVIHVLEERNT